MYCCHITCIGVFCGYHNVISLKRILIFPRLLYIQLEQTRDRIRKELFVFISVRGLKMHESWDFL